jgi:hypothetical protein
MTDNTNLKGSLDFFKSQMSLVNNSLKNFEGEFNKIKFEVEELRSSFAYIVKIINHELVEALENSTKIANELLNK